MVVLTCCKGDGQSQWKTPIFGPSHHINGKRTVKECCGRDSRTVLQKNLQRSIHGLHTPFKNYAQDSLILCQVDFLAENMYTAKKTKLEPKAETVELLQKSLQYSIPDIRHEKLSARILDCIVLCQTVTSLLRSRVQQNKRNIVKVENSRRACRILLFLDYERTVQEIYGLHRPLSNRLLCHDEANDRRTSETLFGLRQSNCTTEDLYSTLFQDHIAEDCPQEYYGLRLSLSSCCFLFSIQ